MFAELLALSFAQIAIPLGPKPRVNEQPRAPIESAGPQFRAACGTSTLWNQAAPPVRIHANSYYVGTCGIATILITGADGHILVDGGTDKAPDLIADNIRTLGFRLADIKYILVSHEHNDHVGGVARLQQLTGATVVASAAAARAMAVGKAQPDDPQLGSIDPFPAVQVGRVVGDGSKVRLGDIQVTAHATPGHTAGAMSWTWESCDGGVCRSIAYIDSLTAVSNKRHRFTDHPDWVAAFRASLAKVEGLRCEILMTPHPDASNTAARFGAGKPLLDAEGCRNYAASRTRMLDDRLAREAAPPPPPAAPSQQ
jgi:metallo-beta-lactamase class B